MRVKPSDLRLSPAQLFGLLVSDLPDFQTEFRFFPARRWRFDFAWPAQKVAVEIHGAEYSRGRHVRGDGFKKDREKMNRAQLEGWVALEFTGTQVKDEAARVLAEVEEALEKRS